MNITTQFNIGDRVVHKGKPGTVTNIDIRVGQIARDVGEPPQADAPFIIYKVHDGQRVEMRHEGDLTAYQGEVEG